MLYTKKIIQLIELAVASANVKGVDPVNIMLIANSEAGKTEIMDCFRKIKFVRRTADLCYKNLVEDILPMLEKKEKRVIMIPDFLKIIMRKKSTSDNLLSMLLPLIEEGLENVDVGVMKHYDPPVRCALITGIPPAYLIKHIKKWKDMGLYQRFISVSYSYTDEQKDAIREYIASGKAKKIDEVSMNIGIKTITASRQVMQPIKKKAKEVADSEGMIGFRLQKRLQTLCKASAYLKNRNKVCKSDVKLVLSLLRYMNRKCEHL